MSRIQQLQTMFDNDPTDAEAAYMLAQEHAKAQDYAQAVAWYDRTLEIQPNHHYAYYHKAKAQQATGDEGAARATLEQGLSKAQTDRAEKAVREIQVFLDSLNPEARA